MIDGENKVLQAFLGTLMTWGLTAVGSALVFLFSTGRFSGKRQILDGSLGFAAGVMTAASYWSLLAPGIEMARDSGYYGTKFVFVPVAIGFALGGLFVFLSDWCLPHFAGKDPAIALAMHPHHNIRNSSETKNNDSVTTATEASPNLSFEIISATNDPEKNSANVEPAAAEESSSSEDRNSVILTDAVELKVRNRKVANEPTKVILEYQIENIKDKEKKDLEGKVETFKSWKRILLLIIAITVHNIPEGLAVGVAFGAIGSVESATFESARSLAIGIGIQNFPEGMAVSIPLCAAGYSPLKSFWYGQLSGMVEPIFGVLGALIVVVAKPLLPYALAFAAGAMIYVVVDDIIPEANMCGNGRIASWGCMVGFIIMMSLDVGLG